MLKNHVGYHLNHVMIVVNVVVSFAVVLNGVQWAKRYVGENVYNVLKICKKKRMLVKKNLVIFFFLNLSYVKKFLYFLYLFIN
jgi:hypothetical protein